MLYGFSMTYGHDHLELWCDVCCANGELGPVYHAYTDVTVLDTLVAAARNHKQKH